MDCRADAAEAVVKASGLKGAKVFFTNAGAESNENAIKIARQFTGKQKVFSQYRCYHGSSAGAGMLTGEPRHFFNEPGGPGFVKMTALMHTEHLRLANLQTMMKLQISTLNY